MKRSKFKENNLNTFYIRTRFLSYLSIFHNLFTYDVRFIILYVLSVDPGCLLMITKCLVPSISFTLEIKDSQYYSSSLIVISCFSFLFFLLLSSYFIFIYIHLYFITEWNAYFLSSLNIHTASFKKPASYGFFYYY